MNTGRMISTLIGTFGGAKVGRMVGGRTGAMIGSMAGSLLAGRMRSQGGVGGIGDLLGGLVGGGDTDQAQSVAAEMDSGDATVLIKAMCNATKADGNIGDEEVDAILSRAGDLDGEEEAWLRQELAAPLDLGELLSEVRPGMEADVYAASLLPIEVDTPSEVAYLGDLAKGLGLNQDQVNLIHTELGVD